MAGNLQTFTDDNFQTDVLSSDQLVVVDFWATWCQPCLMLTPTLEAVAEEFAGKCRVGKLNVDQNRKTASSYGITSIPAVLFFKGGEIVDKLVGLQPKAKFVNAINSHVGAAT